MNRFAFLFVINLTNAKEIFNLFQKCYIFFFYNNYKNKSNLSTDFKFFIFRYRNVEAPFTICKTRNESRIQF